MIVGSGHIDGELRDDLRRHAERIALDFCSANCPNSSARYCVELEGIVYDALLDGAYRALDSLDVDEPTDRLLDDRAELTATRDLDR